jgi:hypothetical protein
MTFKRTSSTFLGKRSSDPSGVRRALAMRAWRFDADADVEARRGTLQRL